jgi:quercetin dioxygenase-like cupin family protein
LIFALYEHRQGVETASGNHVAYDIAANRASFGAARVEGPALLWALSGGEESLVTYRYKVGSTLEVEVELDRQRASEWVMRCDRVDFPPGGTAYRHVHPGPGIRRLLFGGLTVQGRGQTHTHGPGDAWFEDADYPVLATASATEDTAFVRVLLLPAEWAGKRTIRYLDPGDEDKPKLQRAEVLLEAPVEL